MNVKALILGTATMPQWCAVLLAAQEDWSHVSRLDTTRECLFHSDHHGQKDCA